MKWRNRYITSFFSNRMFQKLFALAISCTFPTCFPDHLIDKLRLKIQNKPYKSVTSLLTIIFNILFITYWKSYIIFLYLPNILLTSLLVRNFFNCGSLQKVHFPASFLGLCDGRIPWWTERGSEEHWWIWYPTLS